MFFLCRLDPNKQINKSDEERLVPIEDSSQGSDQKEFMSFLLRVLGSKVSNIDVQTE